MVALNVLTLTEVTQDQFATMCVILCLVFKVHRRKVHDKKLQVPVFREQCWLVALVSPWLEPCSYVNNFNSP